MLDTDYKPVIIAELQCSDTNTLTYAIDKHYASLIENSGGVMLFITPETPSDCLESIMQLADGMMILGGNDINPALYGEEDIRQYSNPFVPVRDAFEPKMLEIRDNLHIPYLGICRGSQILNVYRGGTLNQNPVSSSINHWQSAKPEETTHGIRLLQNTPLSSIPDYIYANSFHHQSIKHLGKNLCVAAQTKDDTIEAIYDIDEPFCCGIQWHPEYLQNDSYTKVLMCRFMQACRDYHEHKQASSSNRNSSKFYE